ncbi:MAG TPA: tRNA (adenosine(37)-N6)-threonylcarbamoyltransferase complex ATPase subunit type 1 TsaE, partial [Povalibacter sp.]|nr:tRNA (adenosine(37)-N6)-threonylcarbamoyltransferase complex ATPase subunit type 1 TsaE [Povalibacter sp.]
LRVDSADAMRSLGRALGRALLAPSDKALVIAIRGELGAGKTTLVGGVLNALGFGGTARSPTYTLIEPYETLTRRIFHLDLYRLADPQEVEALGLRDLLTADAALLIEWPERGAGVVPPADLAISIRYVEAAGVDVRDVELAAHGSAGSRLLAAILNVE